MTSKFSYKRLATDVDPSRPNQRHNYHITDFFRNYEEISKIPGPKHHGEFQESKDDKKTCWRIVSDFFNLTHPSHWVFLVLSSVFMIIIAVLIDLSVQSLIKIKLHY